MNNNNTLKFLLCTLIENLKTNLIIIVIYFLNYKNQRKFLMVKNVKISNTVEDLYSTIPGLEMYRSK